MAYVGTFSSPLRDTLPTQVDLPPGNGKGIHIFEVDRATGGMTERGWVAMGNSPSCLAVNSKRTHLYSANETDRVGPEKYGTVSAFEIDSRTGQLKLVNSADVGSQGPTYVSLHPTERYLFTANYFGGSVTVLPINSDGSVGEKLQVVQDTGEIGPTVAMNGPRGSFAFSGHDRTHAHMVQTDPSGKFVLHVDLGLDTIFVSKLDEKLGQLAAHTKYHLPAGDGPRHFAFHPQGNWLYSIQEEASTVACFEFDSQTGSLSQRQTISTLPESFIGSNFCSEILVSPNGRYLYAGNRLYDSIAVFAIGTDGRITYQGEQWTHGNYPRSFAFSPNGKFLYCCNQRADNVAIFSVDEVNGGLEFTGQFSAVGNPSHIVFVDLEQRD